MTRSTIVPNLSEPVRYGTARDLSYMIDDTRARSESGDRRVGTAHVECVGQVTCVHVPAVPEDGIYLGESARTLLHYVDAHASLSISDDGALSVMCVDARQRELNVRRVARSHVDYASGAYAWSSYIHGVTRGDGTVTRDVARRFVRRFVHLSRDYPSLLWQTRKYARPSDPSATLPVTPAAPFVHLSDALAHGSGLSVRILP